MKVSNHRYLYGEPKTRREDILQRVQLTWEDYLPAVALGLGTIGCIFGSHSIHTRRAAAVASAYSVTETILKKYQDKVIEAVGPEKAREIHSEINNEAVQNNPPKSNTIYISGVGDTLCLDTLSGRYFYSDMESLRRAQNTINERCINSASAYSSMNDFYDLIGLSTSVIGEQMGWRSDHLMQAEFTSALTDDGRPCISIGYFPLPTRNYWQTH